MELQLLGGAEADDSVGRAHGSDDGEDATGWFDEDAEPD